MIVPLTMMLTVGVVTGVFVGATFEVLSKTVLKIESSLIVGWYLSGVDGSPITTS